MLSEIQLPALPANSGWSYQEVSRRHGDFALAGAASVVALDANGNIAHARLTLTGTTPIRAAEAEQSMLGEKPSEALFRNAAERATENLEQDSDIHASAEYRRSACHALALRALAQAAGTARPRADGLAEGAGRPAKAPGNRNPARGRSAGGRGPSYPKASAAPGTNAGRGAGGRKDKPADRQAGAQPDPMKTAFGYIGADSFSRQRQDGAGRPRGGQGGQRRGGRNR